MLLWHIARTVLFSFILSDVKQEPISPFSGSTSSISSENEVYLKLFICGLALNCIIESGLFLENFYFIAANLTYIC